MRSSVFHVQKFSVQMDGMTDVKTVNGERRPFSYDLAVAYRIYPKVSQPAKNLPFGDDKLCQAEVCLSSFRKSLGGLRVKIWAILDNCPESYRNLFERYFAARDIVFVNMPAAGNRATFGRQIDVLLGQDDADLVYFAEDDYVYLPNVFENMVRFIRASDDVDFVSPYDHPDCYTLDIHREPKWVTVFEDRHWRSAASTCLTFLTRKKTLAKYERVLRSFCRPRGDDCALWLSLTKRRVFQPLAFLHNIRQGPLYRNVLLKAWLLGWRQVLFGRRVTLWLPMPSIATHLSEGLLAPGIDWESVMRQATNRASTPIRSCNSQ